MTTNTPVYITSVNLENVEDVVSLFNNYRIFYKQVSDPDGARAWLTSRLANNESVIFVAKDVVTGHSVGFTQLYPKYSSVRMVQNWILNDLYVDAAARKKGVGELLIKAVFEFAGLKNAKFVELSTAVDNFTAQGLYEKLGFIRQAEDSEFYTYRHPLQ